MHGLKPEHYGLYARHQAGGARPAQQPSVGKIATTAANRDRHGQTRKLQELPGIEGPDLRLRSADVGARTPSNRDSLVLDPFSRTAFVTIRLVVSLAQGPTNFTNRS